MSVLIKGMEMPKGYMDIRVHSNGEVCMVNWQGDETVFFGAKAVNLPPHGRLIDADALIKSDRMVGKMMMYGGEYVYCQAEIDRAPTIIQAEEGET